jgi:hypothetical protein
VFTYNAYKSHAPGVWIKKMSIQEISGFLSNKLGHKLSKNHWDIFWRYNGLMGLDFYTPTFSDLDVGKHLKSHSIPWVYHHQNFPHFNDFNGPRYDMYDMVAWISHFIHCPCLTRHLPLDGFPIQWLKPL